MKIEAKYICAFTVNDPDTHAPIEIELFKLSTGEL